ncbi:zinc finger MYM-type protein 3-like [Periophthalmus magnuspinnatus]|uniref:zinc finger MYM-type protein 3-like n=1 Tax=Periophthalmus magnuspinnatus TaxID=409849 RepID=UPI002436857C|nr:zinc finger MYM-type protein 3-like [Periophthalmus magnuspinnatus]
MKGRIENIFNDQLFNQFVSEITDMLKHWKPSGAMIPLRVEESFLWECKQLGAYSPLVLLNTLLFFFTKHFGLVTVDDHASLSFTDVSLCSKPCSRVGRVSYLQYTRRRGPILNTTGVYYDTKIDRLSISRSILPSLENKTPRYLNSSTDSPPTRRDL